MTGRVQSLKVEGFRSVRGLEIRFDDVNLISGPNGCGKSNLFNAFRLLKAALEGQLAAAIADEGGMESVLWSGPRPDKPPTIKLAITAEPFDYKLELGVRPYSEMPLFPLDPQVKSEMVMLAGKVMVDRKRSVAKMKSLEGVSHLRNDLNDAESIFSQIGDPASFHYLYALRDLVSRWTFYHEFRTDSGSALRRPALATFSSRLAEDGSNLGPMMFVISERGQAERMREILKQAIPEARLVISRETVEMEFEGTHRCMRARELSDGTLKFLCLAAACFPLVPPPLIAFNEPEASLNPRMFEPLAEMFENLAQSSQLWITTHSEGLSDAIVRRMACRTIRLEKRNGETAREGRSLRHGWISED